MMKEFSYFNFRVEGTEMPMLRHALLCCALTSKKSLENVSRIIFRSDFEKLKTSLQGQAIKLEGVLKTSWGKIDVSKPQHVQAYGKLAVRCVLFLLQKQKHGRDESMWTSFEEICEAFGLELISTPSSASASSAAEGPHGSVVRNLLSASAAEVALLQHDHLKVGEKYVTKESDKIYILQELTDTHCIFVNRPIFGDCVRVECEFKDAKQWKKTKKDVTQLCDAKLALQKVPENSAAIADDWDKTQITYLLFQAYMECSKGVDSVAFAAHPTGLVSTKKLKKKDLQLYPIGNVVKMKDQSKLDTSKGLYVKWKGQAWTLQPYKTFTSFDKPEETGILCPYMFVKTADEDDAVNMALSEVNYKGLTIPMLENPAIVKEHCWLYRGGASDDGLPPKKKAKAK